MNSLQHVEERSIPLPPKEYIDLVCGARADVETHFVAMAQTLVALLHSYGLLIESCRLLDVGCGCGRVARNLINEPLCSYTGFDRHRGMIDWCKREIEPRAPHFSFFYFDLRSCYQSIDKQSGTIAAGSFQFPFDDNCFDVAFLSSVFTHMPLDEVRHYLHELSRVLANGGKVLFSVFFTKQARFVDSINYHHNPEEVRDAVVSAGLQLSSDDSTRLLTGNKLAFDRCQQNWLMVSKR